ncbi:metallophosphoesterase family protein [Paenibacillus daejeonensis]|uniref:metallophosphoesterase family protein n=1 Tax=Paenibacillus daejeonensis TaxID=135193 RepID=UPI00036F62D5|nr:metallophosphoesterase family protein [Paenibacillus daejeonensis]
MKALILSDIHSNVVALEAIVKAEPEYDVIYCAGDLVDYGPFPAEVIGWMQEHRVTCVRGNHDDIIIDVYRNGGHLHELTDGESKWAHHNARLLGESEITYLEQNPTALSFEMDGIHYTMQHLYQDYLTIDSLPKFDAFWNSHHPDQPDMEQQRRLIFGHTHRRCVHYLSDNSLWLNPGSVSYRRPDDPTKAAHYCTITDGVISLKHVVYDRTPLWEATEKLRLREDEMRVARVFFRD